MKKIPYILFLFICFVLGYIVTPKTKEKIQNPRKPCCETGQVYVDLNQIYPEHKVSYMKVCTNCWRVGIVAYTD